MKKKNDYLDMQILRFTTAGSVDDGKSTLIGRLLYDSKAIFQDQINLVSEFSKRKGEETLNLALFTDGLKAEREQGITMDVAYRYFATPKRKFIIADTPGHIQYTRNMVTGASTANLAIILVDARNGIVEQTKRHLFIASLLKIPHIITCINKMDLVDYSKAVFQEIREEIEKIGAKMGIKDIRFVPICAKFGDNVVERSKNTPWFEGSTLMYLLENINILPDINLTDARFPIQYIIRPQMDKYHDYRGYSGRIASGIFKVGDQVTILPSGFLSKIKSINTPKGEEQMAFAPQSIAVTLEDDIDISRGDMIVKEGKMPENKQDIEAMICWLNEKPLQPNGRYILKHTTNEVKAIVKEVIYKLDINKLEKANDNKIGLNDIGKIKIRTAKPIFFDSYNQNRTTGSIIMIDEQTNETVCAGMIE